MNDTNDPNRPASQGGSASPPPPPPGHAQQQQPAPPPYYFAPPPAQRRGSSLATIGLMISLAIAVFVVGLYAGIILMSRDTGPYRTTFQTGEGRQNVAILPISGVIDDFTSDFVHRAVEDILEDDGIRAVVLRIESPGGGVTASDEILHSVSRLRTERDLPIIASYGDYAASGGYYVSCQADHIFIQPTTITGSIGVILPAFTFEQLLEMVGVEAEFITSTIADEKDFASPVRSWDDETREKVRERLDYMQERFIDVIAEGRSHVLDEQEIRDLATGRVFAATEALEVKLVDESGYIHDAIRRAVQDGNFAREDPPVVIYRPRTGLGAMLGFQAQRQTSAPTPNRVDAATVRQWANELSVPEFLYLYRP